MINFITISDEKATCPCCSGLLRIIYGDFKCVDCSSTFRVTRRGAIRNEVKVVKIDE